jgi:hypothetical protein
VRAVEYALVFHAAELAEELLTGLHGDRSHIVLYRRMRVLLSGLWAATPVNFYQPHNLIASLYANIPPFLPAVKPHSVAVGQPQKPIERLLYYVADKS